MTTVSKADQRFAENVYRVFNQNRSKLLVEVKEVTDAHLDVEVRIEGKGRVGFRLIVTTKVANKSEYDPDPRMFGDTAEVTARAMRDWYPGKTNSWTETNRTVVLQGWNLPSAEMPDYTAKFVYDASGMTKWSGAYAVEQIIQLVQERIRELAAERRQATEADLVAKVDDAFKDL